MSANHLTSFEAFEPKAVGEWFKIDRRRQGAIAFVFEYICTLEGRAGIGAVVPEDPSSSLGHSILCTVEYDM